MKFMFKSRRLILLAILSVIILFTGCNQKTADNNNPATDKNADTTTAEYNKTVAGMKSGCEGYTGKLSDPRAERLVKTCHFIPADLIQEWTERYQKNKKIDNPDKLAGIGDLLGDSSSFNSCIIRKIISNEKCIGLRVVYGMSEDKKIHVIFVGINPDYSSLYIREEDACCDGRAQAAAPPIGKIGGAEYGQMP